MSDKRIRLPRRCFIYPKQTFTVAVRGVAWVCDSCVMVRADALVKAPDNSGPDTREAGVRRILSSARGEGVRLDYSSRVTHEPPLGLTPVRFLQGRGRAVALNDEIADVWLSQPWASITQDREPFIEFREKRRGRPVLVGLVMPVRLAGIVRAAS